MRALSGTQPRSKLLSYSVEGRDVITRGRALSGLDALGLLPCILPPPSAVVGLRAEIGEIISCCDVDHRWGKGIAGASDTSQDSLARRSKGKIDTGTRKSGPRDKRSTNASRQLQAVLWMRWSLA